MGKKTNVAPEKRLLHIVITSIINISQSYGEKTNVAPEKRLLHIVVQCNINDLFNKVIFHI